MADVNLNFDILKPEYIKAAVNSKVDGELFSDRIWNNKAALADNIKQSLIDAMKGNVTIDKIGKNIQGLFNVQAYESQRLVRTENARVQAQAIDDIAENCGLTKQMYCATLESLTCTECGELDGQYFDVDDESKPDIPLHPNCRCLYINVPYDGWQPTVRKDGETRDIIDYEDYNQWAIDNGIIDVSEPEFVPADNLKDAEQFLIDNNLADKVDYSGIDVKVANQMNESISETLNKFPELRKNFQFVGTAQGRNAEEINQKLPAFMERIKRMFPDWSDAKAKEYAEKSIKKFIGRINGDIYAQSCATDGIKGITVNKKWGKDIQMFFNYLKNDVVHGWHPSGCDTVKSVVDHELGHELDKLLDVASNKDIMDLYSDINSVKTGLSRYGTTNIKEMIAEGWSEYMNNPNPRPIAKKIGETIERMYKLWNKI